MNSDICVSYEFFVESIIKYFDTLMDNICILEYEISKIVNKPVELFIGGGNITVKTMVGKEKQKLFSHVYATKKINDDLDFKNIADFDYIEDLQERKYLYYISHIIEKKMNEPHYCDALNKFIKIYREKKFVYFTPWRFKNKRYLRIEYVLTVEINADNDVILELKQQFVDSIDLAPRFADICNVITVFRYNASMKKYLHYENELSNNFISNNPTIIIDKPLAINGEIIMGRPFVEKQLLLIKKDLIEYEKQYNERKLKRGYELLFEAVNLLNDLELTEEYERKKIKNIRKILFKNDGYESDNGYIEFDENFKNNMILRLLDLSEVNFDNVDVRGVDFSNTNIHINPQTVYNKDLSNCNLTNVKFNPFSDFFDGCILDGTVINDWEAVINLERVKSYNDETRITRDVVVDDIRTK